jgi:hypothetical protein
MGIVHETAHYSGVRIASRFAALWFLPTLLQTADAKSLPVEKIETLSTKYASMVAEDLRIHKPALAVIVKDVDIHNRPFDFVKYFSDYASFRAEWKNYEKFDELELAHKDYFTKSEYDNGTVLKYDVYRRKPGK